MLKPFRPLSHVGLVSGGVSPAGILASFSSQSLCKRPLMRCNRVKPRRRTNVDVKDVRAHEGAASRLQLLTKVYPTSFTIFHKLTVDRRLSYEHVTRLLSFTNRSCRAINDLKSVSDSVNVTEFDYHDQTVGIRSDS